jgi:hypothetical protein
MDMDRVEHRKENYTNVLTLLPLRERSGRTLQESFIFHGYLPNSLNDV